MGVLITPMTLAHPLHPIKDRSRNKSRNLLVGWCLSCWRPWFWPVHSIHYIHTTHYSLILTIGIYSFWDIHTNSWYGHAGVLDDSILCGFSCMFQYSLCHGMDIGTCDIVHWSAASHDCIANRTGIWVYVVLVLSVIGYSCHYFLDRILFHDFQHDCCDYHWDFYGHLYLLIYTLGFLYISRSGSANAQLPGCFCP